MKPKNEVESLESPDGIPPSRPLSPDLQELQEHLVVLKKLVRISTPATTARRVVFRPVSPRK